MEEEVDDFVVDQRPSTIHTTPQGLIAYEDDCSDIASLWWRSGAEIVQPRSAKLIQNLDAANTRYCLGSFTDG